jgi:hypothetical protein
VVGRVLDPAFAFLRLSKKAFHVAERVGERLRLLAPVTGRLPARHRGLFVPVRAALRKRLLPLLRPRGLRRFVAVRAALRERCLLWPLSAHLLLRTLLGLVLCRFDRPIDKKHDNADDY